ncbi:hypothetical protein QSH57_004484 [Fusarium oxysporum f. sp. vasinfectum]|nr:hypothetical protein QSH57_004484 [Fusarium oxysporum f. sp. vasinfectum]
MNDTKDKQDVEGLAVTPSHVGEVVDDPASAHDAVFGVIQEDGPNYRDVGWLGTSALMMKTQIGLGVLSIPSAFDVLGMIPGIICLIMIGSTVTWSNYIVGAFKLRHREVYGIDDAAALMFGPIGRHIFAVGFILYVIFSIGGGMLGISIGLNAISTHAACTAVFVAAAAIMAFLFGSIQTLGRISWLAWVGVVSLLTAVFMVTIAVGVQDRPPAAPAGEWVSDYKLFASPTFTQAMTAVSTFIFAYGGTPIFFPIAAEMRDPHHYARSLLLCQVVVSATYIAVGLVVYYYCGSYVASPALGSAGKTIKQASYGLALPGLIVSCTLGTHVASKYIFVRVLRGSKHLTSNTFTHWTLWLGCNFGIAITGYIIASAIPVFGTLVALIGALLGTLQSFQPMGCMWLYDNWSKGKEQRSRKWMLMVCWSVFVIVSGTFLMVAGTYSAILGIIDSYKADGGTKAFACADNSNSV